MLSKESKCVAIAPLPGLGCHPRVGRRHPEVIRDPGVKAALGPVRCVCVEGVFAALGATALSA